MSAGYDFLDLDFLRQRGIPFATSGDLNSSVVAEHTVALILALLRRLVRADAALRAGSWLMQEPETDPYSYGELYGKRVGIIGLGNIGRNVARRLRGFDCHLQYASRRPLSAKQERELCLERVDLEQLFETSDVVTLHTALTPQTRRIVNRDRLKLMKPSAILINTSRGPVVDEAALIEALREGKIAGAGLDVFDSEPPRKDNPLLRMDNVVVTPHCAGGSSGTQERIISFSWQNIKAFLSGETPRNLITKD